MSSGKGGGGAINFLPEKYKCPNFYQEKLRTSKLLIFKNEVY